jgi:hypothetical protein
MYMLSLIWLVHVVRLLDIIVSSKFWNDGGD